MQGIGLAGSAGVGLPMLARLNAAGLPAAGYGLGATAPGEAADDGTRAAEFAAGLRVLILLARDIAEAEALLFETAAFARRATALEAIVIAATLSPRYVRALRGRIGDAVALIDAPFTGGMRAAAEGRLSFLLGGRPGDIARLQPVFDILGRQSHRMGAYGTAMASKVLSDCLAATSTAMTRIALDWAEAQGIDEAQLLEMIGASMGRNPGGPGTDPAGFGPDGSAEAMSHLISEIEGALDTALTGAHLIPPRAMEQIFRTMKSRALH
ncbi:MAG: NAD(P)-dependent oxidoreductase [Alphaproteobacteria bacterium HGW-Alphaproteobacteria-6]|nr:MAG: NAD(P)-dependent oxidoreductase [Alphaproteobacteria bacterium HGW-Alphaproteobacteria-6]